MKPIPISSAVVLSIALVACGEAEAPKQDNAGVAADEAGAPQAGEIYSATGDVTDVAGDRITISHGPVEAIGWPAMSMTFKAASPEVVQGISVGDRVSFEFRQTGHEYELTSLGKAQ